jgi:hypothetical protein
MKITNLDKKSLVALRDPIEQALAELGQQLGLKFKVGSGSYGGATGHFKLEIAVDDPAVQEEKKRAQFNANCRHIGIDFNDPENSGLRPEDFGAEFQSGGVRYKVVGLALSRSKCPIECLALSGPKEGKVLLFQDGLVRLIRAATDAKAKAEAA